MDMDNVLYSKTIRPANKSPDGETPLRIVVAKEANAVMVWLDGSDESINPVPLRVHYDRNRAIEDAVRLADLPVHQILNRATDIAGLL